MLNFVLPQISCVVGTQNYGRFVISPLENGYGTTLGNALRRVLLSSLDGVAVTSLRVADVSHEFSTIPGVREDMMLFILNVKQIRFITSGDLAPVAATGVDLTPVGLHGLSHADVLSDDELALVDGPMSPARSALGSMPHRSQKVSDSQNSVQAAAGLGLSDSGRPDSGRPDSVANPVGSMAGRPGGVPWASDNFPMRLRLSISGQGVVTAGDILCPPEIEIVNPELYLFTVDDPDAELDIEMTVERGRGYSPSEERGKLPIGELPVDAVFSPIRKANYDVTPARVGQMTNYDSLTLEIWTDGTLRPQQALGISTQLLIRHLTLFAGIESLEAPSEPVSVSAPVGTGVPASMGAPAGLRADGLQPHSGASAAGGAADRAYDVPIEELDLTVRVYNCLKRTGITKVGEVLAKMEKGPDEMLAIRNFGVKSLVELRGKLIEKGYLAEDDFPFSVDAQSDQPPANGAPD